MGGNDKGLCLFSLICVLCSDCCVKCVYYVFSIVCFVTCYFVAGGGSGLLGRGRVFAGGFSTGGLFGCEFIGQTLGFTNFSLLTKVVYTIILLPICFVLGDYDTASSGGPAAIRSCFALFSFVRARFTTLRAAVESDNSSILPGICASILALVLLPLCFTGNGVEFGRGAICNLLVTLFFVSFGGGCTGFF